MDFNSNLKWNPNMPKELQEELQRACFFRNICQSSSYPKDYKIADVKGQLQEGPTCGLCAISMLFKNELKVPSLLSQAVADGHTNNGEMFSATAILDLLEKYPTSEFEFDLHVGLLDCKYIRNELANGSFLLVPYDADHDHSPTMLKGHKAHWCLVIGYIIDENDKFYVLARHGKSKNLAAWSLRHLSDSNGNLEEFSQPKNYPDKLFLLPEGGISGPNGLCQKAIVIKNLEQSSFSFFKC